MTTGFFISGAMLLSEPQTTTVEINGFPCRVWRKGSGPKLGFLAGLGGLPRWIPFLDHLAERRTVIVPSLPGYPGALGHNVLDNHLDWLLAVRRLLAAADLDGADLAGSSVGAARRRRRRPDVRRSGGVGAAQGAAAGRQFAGMGDRAEPRQRGGRARVLAARQHPPREAPAVHRGTHPAHVGRR